MLEHASAAMTLDTYADLFDDDLDAVAEALHHAKTVRVCPNRVRTVPTKQRKPPESRCL